MVLEDGGKSHKVDYVFEQGDLYQGRSREYIEYATSFPPIRYLYAYHSHSYATKQEEMMLQAADVLAWEWAMHVDRCAEGKAVRASLAAILGVRGDAVIRAEHFRTNRFYLRHVSGAQFQNFCESASVILNQTDAEVRAASEAARREFARMFPNALVGGTK